VTARPGFSETKTKMLLGQLTANLGGFQRKLLIELDEKSERTATGKSCNDCRGQPEREANRTGGAMTLDLQMAVPR
jgi:hypothetical protein